MSAIPFASGTFAITALFVSETSRRKQNQSHCQAVLASSASVNLILLFPYLKMWLLPLSSDPRKCIGSFKRPCHSTVLERPSQFTHCHVLPALPCWSRSVMIDWCLGHRIGCHTGSLRTQDVRQIEERSLNIQISLILLMCLPELRTLSQPMSHDCCHTAIS